MSAFLDRIVPQNSKYSFGYDCGIGIGIGISVAGFATGPGCGFGLIDKDGNTGIGAGWRSGLALGPALPIGGMVKIGRFRLPVLFGLVLGPAIGFGTKTNLKICNISK
eukprot:462995_1